MINADEDYGKLHLIMELVGRNDIREHLNSKFSKEEQSEIFNVFKGIMVDELLFVLDVKGKEKNLVDDINYMSYRTTYQH